MLLEERNGRLAKFVNVDDLTNEEMREKCKEVSCLAFVDLILRTLHTRKTVLLFAREHLILIFLLLVVFFFFF